MENWKRYLNEAKEETASVEEIEEVIFDVLKKEGGAAGLQPIEDALKELDKDLPEGFDLKAHIEEMPEEKIKFHDEGDVIEMGGLTEQDQDGDGDKDFADVMMARMKASGMSDEEAKEKTRKHDDNSKKKVKTEVVSEHLSYHLKNKLSLTESVFRAGSDAYIDLVKEARVLWKMGGYQPKIEELELLQSDIGQFGIYEGEEVPLDTPMLFEVELEEAKKKKAKKKPKLNKPMRNTSGGKKYKVFVRNPKTGNIKKVTFGDKKGGLEGNWNDPEARASFAKRHKCAQKKDKTKAGYWACRAHKYFGKNVPGRFW